MKADMKRTDGPNVLLLFCDQLRRDALGCYGNEHVHTPNLDRLAAEGRTYERAYTPVPVCIPARHCLLTGHRPKVHGYWENWQRPMDAGIPTLPRILRDGNYVTEAIGKMHFQPPRSHHGFERMQIMEETPDTREEDDYLLYLKSVGLGNVQHQHGVRHLLYMQPQRALIPEEHTGNHWVRPVDRISEGQRRTQLLSLVELDCTAPALQHGRQVGRFLRYRQNADAALTSRRDGLGTCPAHARAQ